MQAKCHFQCKGRDAEGQEVLAVPVPVVLTFEQCNLNTVFELSVNCRYGHGQRCFASHPHTDKVGEGVLCPYARTIGHIWPKRPGSA